MAESSTVFVKWPIESREEAMATIPYRLTLPYVGLSPTTLQKLAGCLTDPPVSVPDAARHMSVETLTADPLLDPPGTYSKPHGFFVGPKSEFSPLLPCAHASQFVLPIIIAPAFFNFV